MSMWLNLIPDLSFHELINVIPIDSPFIKKYSAMKENHVIVKNYYDV